MPIQPPPPHTDLSPELLARLLPEMGEAISVYSREGAHVARLGPPGGILGHHGIDRPHLFEFVHPDDLPGWNLLLQAAIRSEPGWRGRTPARLRRADGTWGTYEIRIVNRLDDPVVDGFVVSTREVPEALTAELDLEVGDVVESLADVVPVAIAALDLNGIIRYANPPAVKLFGREIVGLQLRALAEAGDADRLASAAGELVGSPGDRVLRFRSNGGAAGRVVETRLLGRGRPGRATVTAVFEDVTVEQETWRELARRATLDPLTAVLNRAALVDLLEDELADDPTRVTVLYIDLDGFKAVNDTLGHQEGDRLLTMAAQRIRSSVRPDDLVGRLGGDEFVVVCSELTEDATAEVMARLARGIEHVGGDPNGVLHASVGVARGEVGDTSSSLLQRADEAMYAAKRSRPGRPPSGSIPSP